jgi:hypothetical protein
VTADLISPWRTKPRERDRRLAAGAGASYNRFMSTTEIFEQALDPFVECLTLESAGKIAALRAAPAVQARLDQLAERANEGSLTHDERIEYERFRAAFHFITLLQSKAREHLKAHRPS